MCHIGTWSTKWHSAKNPLCRVSGQVALGKELKKIKKTFAECQIGGTRQRGDLNPPAGPAHTHRTHAHTHVPAPPPPPPAPAPAPARHRLRVLELPLPR